MPDRQTKWLYDTMATSQDKRTGRSAVKPPYSSEIIGADGQLEGDLRPFPGFKHIHSINPVELESVTSLPHDESSEITDLFPVDFIIGDDGYGYGFVYRIQKGGSTTADVLMDYYNSKLGEWVRYVQLKEATAISARKDAATGRPMSVSVWGRYVYVFISGAVPISFTTDRTSPFASVVEDSLGPGLRPALDGPNLPGGLGSITSTGDPDRPGAGQIFLTNAFPKDLGLGVGDATTDTGSSYESTGAAFATAAPTSPSSSSSAVVTTSSSTSPSTTSSGATTGGSGSTAVSGVTTSEAYSGQDFDDVAELEPGDYAFAYMLSNRQNARRSALSKVCSVRRTDFDVDGENTGADPIALHAVMEITYDSSKFNQAYIYRSVRVQDAGGTYIASILHLEAIIDLSDYATNNNPLSGDLRQAVYFYELNDKELVFQDQFTDQSVFDKSMPLAGASLWYENTMLLSNIKGSMASTTEVNRPADAIRGIGELRWSSLTDVSPELLPPNHRYNPSIPSNTIIAMRQVGPNVVGFSRDRQYVIRKESTYIKVMEQHEGYGVANERCLDTAGSMIYFGSSKGLKTVDSQGQLDDVRSLNQVFVERWASSLEHVSISHDPTVSCLFILNGSLNELQCLWFNGATVTQVQDVPFYQVARGVWPSSFTFDETDLIDNNGANNDDYANTLTERAFFVQNPPKDSASDAITGWMLRIFVMDHLRERVIVGGSMEDEPRNTLLPFDGDSILEVATDFTVGHNLVLDVAGDVGLGDNLWGCEVYVLKAEDPDLEGSHATIRTTITNNTLVLNTSDSAELHGLVAGDIVGISPVYFRWVGHPLGSAQEMTDTGEPIPGGFPGFFKLKHVDTIGATFSEVGGTVFEYDSALVNSVARFRGIVYRGTSETPIMEIPTRDRAGDPVLSLRDDESLYYASMGEVTAEGRKGVAGVVLTPGITVYCPDVTFGLLAIIVQGRVSEAQRASRV